MVGTLEEFVARYGTALVTAAGIVVAGLIADAIIYRVLNARSKARHWRIGGALAGALLGLPTAAAVLIAARILIARLDLPPETKVILLKGFSVVSIVVITAFAARIASKIIRGYAQREGSRLPSSSIFENLARAIVWVLGGLSVLAALGISIAPLLTALGIGGLAVGLALQPTLENVVSGVQVLTSKQIEPGDFIQLETGQQGWVEDVTWRNTTIKMLSNDLVIVPNATIGKSLVTNFTSADEEHVLWVPVGVAYDSDLDHVERVTLEVARDMQSHSEGATRTYEPLLRFTEFGDSAIELRVSLQAETIGERYPLQHEMIKRLHTRYAEEGIKIPFPQRVVHMEPAQ